MNTATAPCLTSRPSENTPRRPRLVREGEESWPALVREAAAEPCEASASTSPAWPVLVREAAAEPFEASSSSAPAAISDSATENLAAVPSGPHTVPEPDDEAEPTGETES